MIIKLKGANFSTNNINALLNSYFVSIMGGSCVTATNNISSVSKDSPTYSNTFTVNTDYTVSNVEVTMGGTNITSDAVDKTSGEAGTVITISNLTVTNNLSIKFTYTYSGSDTGEEDSGETGGTTLLSSSSATFSDGKTLSSASYTMTDNTDYFIYAEIPVVAGYTYQSSAGGGRIWFLKADKTALSTMNIFSATPQYQFTVPSGASYVSIAFAEIYQGQTYADAATASITLISNGNDTEDNTVLETITIANTTAILQDGKNLGTSNATTLTNKANYFTYMNIPVNPSTTYKSHGGTRTWFVDGSGNGISSLNIYKSEGGDQYAFTTPSNCSYVNIAYCADGLITPVPVASTVTLERYS